MGKINVKLAGPYQYEAAAAAADYLQINKTISWNMPKVDFWRPVDGFGDAGKNFATVGFDPSTGKWVAFSVCFLLNQMTGTWGLVDKMFAVAEKDGEITSDFRDLVSKGNSQDVNSALLIGQVFIDSYYSTIDKMNELNNQDGYEWDFNYQFDMSSVAGMEKSKIKSNLDLSGQNISVGSTVPTSSGLESTFEYEEVPGDPSTVFELPGYYGNSKIWSEGDTISFNNTILRANLENQEEAQNECVAFANACFDDQRAALDQLLEQIANGGPE